MPKYILSSTVTIPPATASTATPVACEIKLGLDIHQSKYVVVAQHDHATPKAPRHFAPAEFLPWVDTLLRQGHRLHLVYEACGFGFGLCRQLRERGVDCQVVAPQRLDERHTGVKTDGRDARTLCLRLDRWLAGNADALALIRIPTPAEEQKRQVHRQREQLVHQKTKLEAQGRSLLVNQGLPAPSRWWKARAWEPLQKLLPAWITEALTIYRPLLALLDAQIKALGEAVAARVEQAVTPLPKGVGALTAGLLTAEVCDWSRFRNRAQVSSYTGLCPGEYSSGDKRVQGHVTKHGNPRLRAALVELAWRMVRFQPGYPPVHKRLAILAKGARATGAPRKKAIVAVARQLAVDLWRLATARCTATQLGLAC